MKKCVAWFMAVCLCITLTACNRDREVICSYEQYDIYLEDGHYYMKFNKVNEHVEKVDNHQAPTLHSPKFSSVEEMRQKILAGEVSEKDLSSAYFHARFTDGITEIYDLSHLYEACTPDNTQIKHVTWGGDKYSIAFESTTFDTGYISICTEEMYNQEFSERYANFPNELQTVYSVRNIAERNAEETLYGNHTGEYKMLKYTLSDETRTLYVQETYCLEHWDEDWVSETVPHRIFLFGTEKGAMFYTSFSGLSERPSVDWLSSFGVTPLDNSTD